MFWNRQRMGIRCWGFDLEVQLPDRQAAEDMGWFGDSTCVSFPESFLRDARTLSLDIAKE